MKEIEPPQYSAADQLGMGRSFDLPRKTPEIAYVDESVLYDDNQHNPEADRRREEWNKNRDKNNLTAQWLCGDPRVILPLPLESATVRSIAQAGKPNTYERFLKSPKVKRIAIVAHHDGHLIQPHQNPKGCGGRDTLGELRQVGEMNPPANGIRRYLLEAIQHDDLALQSIAVAASTFELTGKPTLAATQDHRDGTLYPLAVFKPGRASLPPEIAFALIYKERYNPKDLYENGIPTLTQEQIPPEFRDYIDKYEIQAQELNRSIPDLRTKQAINNPLLCSLSTAIRPNEVRYPTIGGQPNSIFKLHLPRTRVENADTINIKSEDAASAWDQAEYVITHATQNTGTDQPFSRTKAFLIETGDMQVSEDLAQDLTKNRDWMQPWFDVGGRLYVAESRAGYTNNIRRFK